MHIYTFNCIGIQSLTLEPELAMSRVTKKPVPKTPPPEAFGI
jgi:hypothetical protein